MTFVLFHWQCHCSDGIVYANLHRSTMSYQLFHPKPHTSINLHIGSHVVLPRSGSPQASDEKCHIKHQQSGSWCCCSCLPLPLAIVNGCKHWCPPMKVQHVCGAPHVWVHIETPKWLVNSTIRFTTLRGFSHANRLIQLNVLAFVSLHWN